MTIVPITYRKACRFITEHHRHHKPPQGGKIFIGVQQQDHLCGVAIIGRPISRVFDNGLTAEVTRTCTDGTKNANSCLYGAAWRIAKAMGYQRLITYIEDGESGISLKAAGWVRVKDLAPRKNWSESSVKLKHLRDPSARSGVGRGLWEICIGGHDAIPERTVASNTRGGAETNARASAGPPQAREAAEAEVTTVEGPCGSLLSL